MVGDTESSKILPSLATVTDLFRVLPPRNLDPLNLPIVFGVPSDLGVAGAPSVEDRLVLLPRLFILKKLLTLAGKLFDVEPFLPEFVELSERTLCFSEPAADLLKN